MRSLDVAPDAWLGALLDEIDEAADRLRAHGPVTPTDLDRARDAAAVATLRLDGSRVAGPPAPIPDPPAGTVTGPDRGGWLEVLRSGTRELTTVPDEVVQAVEHRGARHGLAALDLAPDLGDDLRSALTRLHRRTTDGLLHPSVAGALRRSNQAVHDASLGRVLFFPIDPVHLPDRLDRLATWIADAGDHAVVRSGVLQHQLLDLHPYEAANGRLARIASRLLLAADGIDGELVAQPEEALLRDPIGYLDEVSRSRRLGDPGNFVARWAEAVSDGLLTALGRLDVAPAVDVPSATLAYIATVGADEQFTIVDHRDAVGGGRDADGALARARLAGRVRRVHGTRGLRWRLTSA